MQFFEDEIIDIEQDKFNYDYDHIFKIGYGPNAQINIAPYRACRHLIKEIKKIEGVHHIEVYLYNELARSVKETKVNEDILNGLKLLKLPVKVFNDKKAPKEITHELSFDLVVFNKANKEVKKYTICSLGAGTYSINGVKEPLIYTRVPFIRQLEWIKLHPSMSYFDQLCTFIKSDFVIKNCDNCIKIMDKLIDDGLKAKGKLPLDYLGVTYNVRANFIYNNKRPNETADQRMIRLISSYAYAIGEQIVLKKKMVASPTGSTSPVVWAVLRYLRETYHPTKEQILNAFAASIMICNAIQFTTDISSVNTGCQAGMAAATAMATAMVCVIVYNAGIEEIGRACEMAIEHTLGLICNSVCAVPIVPCIQRTASFAVRAYELAVINHSLMPTKQLVRFDDAALVLYETGLDLAKKYKIAGKEGFAKTARYSLFPCNTKKGGK